MSGNFIKDGIHAITTTLKDNSTTILSAAAVVGVCAAVYFAVKETPKVNKALEEKEEEKGEPLTVLEKAVIVAPGYKGTAAAVIGTVTCIVCAQKQNLDKIAMYSASSVMLKDKLNEVYDSIEKKATPKQAREIVDAPAEDYILSYPPGEDNIVNTGRGVTLCMDDLTGVYFYSDKMAIERAVYKMQAIINEDGFASKNQWLTLLYLDDVSDGDYSGWNKRNNPFDVEYSTMLTADGRPCLVIEHTYNLPVPGFDKYNC